ncbi:MAG: viperin family antiviral radical SAM protein [Bacteroidales bacterium]|nr:viperin family antiviral radical SAM protein [Bacteroidales bacterium]
MDTKNAGESLVIFHGNNLNPLPQELFELWNEISKREYKTEPCACCLTGSYFEICGYDPELNRYESDNFDYMNYVHQEYHPFDTSVALSLYDDRETHSQMFYIAMSTDGEGINPDCYQRNSMVIRADDWLVSTYRHWKDFRDQNPDKYNQCYKITLFKELQHEVDILNAIKCETCLYADQCYGTFCMAADGPIEADVPQREQFKTNLHILEPCNYRCRHCFAHFDSDRVLPVNVWKHIVDNCAEAIFTHEFNIAGGEPLLYKNLNELIRYIHSIGADCSIVTNGFLMDDDWISRNAPFLKTIGFSVDSFDPDTVIALGRATADGKYLSRDRFKQLCEKIKEVNPQCRIKVNTVVSSLTKNENLLSVLSEMPVDKWKIIRMRIFKSGEFDNSDISVTDEEYATFVKRNTQGCRMKSAGNRANESDRFEHDQLEIVVEKDVQGAYIIVDSGGWLIDNSEGESHVPIINCATEDFLEGFRKLSLDRDLYFSRYTDKN